MEHRSCAVSFDLNIHTHLLFTTTTTTTTTHTTTTILLSDKWVNYIELSKRGDFSASTNFYFWYLDAPRLKKTIGEHVYQTMHNLTLR